jgi:hypothetical protein
VVDAVRSQQRQPPLTPSHDTVPAQLFRRASAHWSVRFEEVVYGIRPGPSRTTSHLGAVIAVVAGALSIVFNVGSHINLASYASQILSFETETVLS